MVQIQKQEEAMGILFKVIEPQKYLQANFDGSPAIGAFKVYPKAMQKIKSKRLQLNGPVMEIYSIDSGQVMKTEYFFPIASEIGFTADESN